MVKSFLKNKKRLEKIEPEIELVEILDGKEPKERFTEIGEMIKEVCIPLKVDRLGNITYIGKEFLPKRKG